MIGDTLYYSLILYLMERETGLEPATACLEGRNSTTELLPQNHVHFRLKFAVGQRGVPASSKTELSSLIDGYCLCAQSEAKSPKTIEMVRSSVRYFEEFLCSQGLSTDVADIGVSEIRIFIVQLQQKTDLLTTIMLNPSKADSTDTP